MSENVLRVQKIKRPELHATEYRMQVGVAFTEDELMNVPEKYIAHILANNLREYVLNAVTVEEVEEILVRGVPTVCPRCGGELKEGGE